MVLPLEEEIRQDVPGQDFWNQDYRIQGNQAANENAIKSIEDVVDMLARPNIYTGPLMERSIEWLSCAAEEIKRGQCALSLAAVCALYWVVDLQAM